MKVNQAEFVEGNDWRKESDNFLLAYRTTPNTGTGKVPAGVFFGRSLRTKIPRFKGFGVKQHRMNWMERRDCERKQKIKRYADQRVKAAPSDIAVGEGIAEERNVHAQIVIKVAE